MSSFKYWFATVSLVGSGLSVFFVAHNVFDKMLRVVRTPDFEPVLRGCFI
ncbi:uncharacterized protein J3R85_000606 [Psidium guajava]|nr:uncharacterized protein J3R85_000606 [Psidium guajava]